MTQENWQRQYVKMLQFIDEVKNNTVENTINQLNKTSPNLLSYVDWKKTSRLDKFIFKK